MSQYLRVYSSARAMIDSIPGGTGTFCRSRWSWNPEGADVADLWRRKTVDDSEEEGLDVGFEVAEER